jgi:predicted PurR-regulated permease PerM
LILGIFIALGSAAAYVLLPFWPAFLLALWTASLARPTVERLVRRFHRRQWVSGLAVIMLLVVLVLPASLAMISVSGEAYELVRRAFSSTSGRAALLNLVSESAAGGSRRALDWSVLMGFFRTHGVEAFTAASTVAGAVGAFTLGTFVYLVATYAALMHGERAYLWFESQVPMAPVRLRRLRAAFTETGRGLIVSVAATALVQGALAGVTFVILGVPQAAALGFATFLASLIPTVGSALVWAPVALGLWIAGSNTEAVVLLLVGLGVISSADNVLRPLLARWGNLTLHPFLVLFSMLGGVLAIGGWGIALGPLLLRMALEAMVLLRDVQPPSIPRTEPGPTPQTGSMAARHV